MNVAILGAGFTGLTAALKLLQKGHKVTIFEKEAQVGGLAGGFKRPLWEWSLEKSYHHLFTNDDSILKLAQELNHPIITKRPSTNVLIKDTILPLDSPLSLLTFPYLPLADRLRTGLSLLYLKLIKNHQQLESIKARPWIENWMGQNSWKTIWDPLFTGKFGNLKDEIALTWFWARIKKRTPSLAYPQGGFQSLAERIAQKIDDLGGKIYLNTEVTETQTKNQFDKIIVTLPTPIFTRIIPSLPESYTKKINSIPHLSALNLILILKKPFMRDAYWLNITDKNFPFLVLAEHTNFMDPKYYNNEHILYIGNYLPPNHPYLNMSARQLFDVYKPYLKKINPTFGPEDHGPMAQSFASCALHLFKSPFAQPIVTTNYPKLIPQFQTPLKNILVANMDMVYPWDRGTNYAVEMGEKVAGLIDKLT